MRRWPFIVGIVAYIIFCVVGAEIYREPVDEILEQKAAAALGKAIEGKIAAAGAKIEYTGMQGTLRGVRDAEVAESIVQIVSEQVGAGRLVAVLEKEEPLLPALVPNGRLPWEYTEDMDFFLRPGSKADTYLMRGELANDDLIDEAVDALAFGKKSRWVYAKELRPVHSEEGWQENLGGFLTFLDSKATGISLGVTAESVALNGDLRSVGTEAEVMAEAKKFADGRSIVGKFRDPAALRFRILDDGKIAAQGTLRTEEEWNVFAEKLGEASADLEAKVEFDSTRYTPDGFLQSAEVVANLMRELKGADIQMVGSHMEIRGNVRGAVEQSGVMKAVSGLGESLTVSDQLSVREDYWIMVGKNGDEMGVGGFLPDQKVKGELLAAINGRFPLAPAIDIEGLTTEEENGSSPDWFPRALAALPDLLEASDVVQIEMSREGIDLAGSVRSDESRKIVLAKVEEVSGGELPIRTVEILVKTAPSLRVFLSGQSVKLEGVLPDEEIRDEVESSIRGFLSTLELENKIAVDSGVWYPEWIEPASNAIPEFLAMASESGSAKITIEGDSLVAEAKLESDELTEPIQLLFSPLKRSGLKVSLNVQVLQQPRLMLAHTDGIVRISGRLNSGESEEKLVAAIRVGFPEGKVEDLIVRGQEVAEAKGWEVVVSKLLPLINGLEKPGIDLRPGKVRIDGLAKTEARRLSLEKRLNEAFGETLEIESAIQIPKNLLAEPRVELEIRGGRWALLGDLANEDEKSALIRAVEAVRTKAEIIDELKVTSDVADSPWISEIGPTVAALSKADDPWLKIYGETLIVEGRFSDPEHKRMLVEAGNKLSGVEFDDSTELKTPPEVVVPPPPSIESEEPGT